MFLKWVNTSPLLFAELAKLVVTHFTVSIIVYVSENLSCLLFAYFHTKAIKAN
jgi:hypothetical protein